MSTIPLLVMLVLTVAYALVVVRYGLARLHRWHAHRTAMAAWGALCVIAISLIWAGILGRSTLLLAAGIAVGLVEVFGMEPIFWATGGPESPDSLRAASWAITRLGRRRPLLRGDRKVLRVMNASLERWGSGATEEYVRLMNDYVERCLGERPDESAEVAAQRSARLTELYRRI